MVNNRIKKMLDEPVVCTDGGLHYIDESHKRYLSSQICQLFTQPLEEAKGERDLVWKKVIRESHISTRAMGEIMEALKGESE